MLAKRGASRLLLSVHSAAIENLRAMVSYSAAKGGDLDFNAAAPRSTNP